ncbi:uncharacterized protein BO96DRAFT_470068 [Aspergillus niger CBS 101883]|uniref:Contig An01c0080, genomic contig n=2 Tax=Aspergillus niger TaxID=5061 RepID=A2Q801_ASPNC|nr:uncharacterized protein BO96DRAFT_470068 [Aspergillus niger CBS 101883]XP_059603123.1 uncharacterized protein An01g02550 [Aspergillus niger]PYH51389.1 hypothetical protein BO96DRAFT_470068 [Aspergillus niger CBS 101883]CAK43624.1 unnamed protein product [Aspergillus niger]
MVWAPRAGGLGIEMAGFFLGHDAVDKGLFAVITSSDVGIFPAVEGYYTGVLSCILAVARAID